MEQVRQGEVDRQTKEKDTANKKRRDRRAKDSKQKRREKRAAGSNSSAFRMKLQSELRALVDDVYRSARKGGSDGDLDALHWKNKMYSVFGLDKDSALIPEVGTPSDIVLLENSHIQDLKEALDTMGVSLSHRSGLVYSLLGANVFSSIAGCFQPGIPPARGMAPRAHRSSHRKPKQETPAFA